MSPNVLKLVKDGRLFSASKFPKNLEGNFSMPLLPTQLRTFLIACIYCSFISLHSVIHPRAVTEFTYRYNSPTVAHVFLSFILDTGVRSKEVASVLSELKAQDMKGFDISDDEFAKSHARYMIGGAKDVPHERVFRFGTSSLYLSDQIVLATGNLCDYYIQAFPERPGALRKFLLGLQRGWNISLFHYRNHGAGEALHSSFKSCILTYLYNRSRKSTSRDTSSSRR